MRTSVGLLLIAATAIPCRGSLVYLSQARSLEGLAQTINLLDSAALNAPGFDEFEESFQVSVELGGTFARAGAAQHSVLEPAWIAAGMGIDCLGGGSNPPSFCEANNRLVVTFSVAVPTPFLLEGALAWSASGPREDFAAVRIQLTSAGSEIFAFRQGSSSVGSLSLTNATGSQGVLTPGTYMLEAIQHSEGHSSMGGSSQLDFRLSVPSPATLATGMAGMAMAFRRRRLTGGKAFSAKH